jgi:hypothetical protein
MEKATRVAERVLIVSALLALVLGVVIWVGDAYGLIDTHELIAYVLIASLWTLAFIAARSGVSMVLVVLAAGWGVLAMLLGWGQQYLLTGSWHWVIQVLHVVISMAAVGWGRVLASRIRRTQRGRAVAGSTTARW